MATTLGIKVYSDDLKTVILSKEIPIDFIDIHEEYVVVHSLNRFDYLKLDVTDEGLRLNEVSSKEIENVSCMKLS